MKLNLTLNGEARDGYTNIDPFPSADPRKVRGDIRNLTEVDDGEAEEIIAIDVLDRFTLPDTEKVITHWISKLKHGGELTIGFTDLIELAKAIANRSVNLDQANQILFGSGQAWEQKRTALAVVPVCNMLRSKGLNITLKRSQAFKAIIKAVRP
jgi:hypothetical protein